MALVVNAVRRRVSVNSFDMIWDAMLFVDTSRARCKDQPTEIFFAADNARGAKVRRNELRAKQLCQSCPILEPCRSYALNAREPYGVWGGLTPLERQYAWVARG